MFQRVVVGGKGWGGRGVLGVRRSHFVTPTVLTRLACRHPRRVLQTLTFFLTSSERGGRDETTK